MARLWRELYKEFEKYYEFRDKINEKHPKDLYDRYFNSLLQVFSNFSEKVKDYMFIFVGQAKIRGIPIPIDDIIIEHLRTFDRIKTEHLVVLKRKWDSQELLRGIW